MTLDLHSWGFRRTLPISDVIDMHTLLSTLVETIRFELSVYAAEIMVVVFPVLEFISNCKCLLCIDWP